jgi:aspartate/methionine/tyrosine aminotransferase
MPLDRLMARPAGVRPTIERLDDSLIMEVSRLGFGDPDIIPLWYGEGDRPTPTFICDAAAASLARGETFYTHQLGLPSLRAALAGYESGLHARPVADDRICVTSSGMQGIFLTIQALVEPGDNVLVICPVWPNIRGAIEIFGGEARQVALGADSSGAFHLDLDALERAIDPRTRAVFVNSPSNPTGWVMTADEAAALLTFTRRHGVHLIADEVYARIIHDRRVAPSLLDLAEPEDRVVVVNSFSKNWAMTGWRLGWLVVPPDLRPTLAKLIQYNTSGAPVFIQRAGEAAITQGEGFIDEMRRVYRAGRDLVTERLRGFGRVRLVRPDGAFYAFFAVDGVTDSLGFAKEILAKTKVGLAPGAAFGRGGEGYLRLCFAASAERLGPAMDRLSAVLG